MYIFCLLACLFWDFHFVHTLFVRCWFFLDCRCLCSALSPTHISSSWSPLCFNSILASVFVGSFRWQRLDRKWWVVRTVVVACHGNGNQFPFSSLIHKSTVSRHRHAYIVALLHFTYKHLFCSAVCLIVECAHFVQRQFPNKAINKWIKLQRINSVYGEHCAREWFECVSDESAARAILAWIQANFVQEIAKHRKDTGNICRKSKMNAISMAPFHRFDSTYTCTISCHRCKE